MAAGPVRPGGHPAHPVSIWMDGRGRNRRAKRCLTPWRSSCSRIRAGHSLIGILLFGPAAGTTVAEDATSANDIGIYNFGDNSSIDTNRVLSHRFEGIVLAGQPPGAEVILDWGSRH